MLRSAPKLIFDILEANSFKVIHLAMTFEPSQKTSAVVASVWVYYKESHGSLVILLNAFSECSESKAWRLLFDFF